MSNPEKNINTNSSTYYYLVRVYYVLNQVVCTRYFLKDQGYKIHDNVIYQDIQSAIKLENNGGISSRKWTRHTNIRYYFITDRVTNQEAYVEFCTTLEMIEDYFKKAMQGSQFCHCRNIILVIHEYHIPSYNSSRREFLEELTIKIGRGEEESQKADKLPGD